VSERGDGGDGFGAVLSRFGRGVRGALRPRRVLIVLVAIVVVAALAVWGRAMVTPVTRAGEPTATVQPLPAPTSASPSASPSASGTPTASGSAQPSATPSKPPTMKSSGKFATAGVQVDPVSSLGELRTYTVRVETSSGLKADKVATQIAGVLNDPRSWAGSGGIRFGLVKDPAKADFSITLASPGTAAKTCKTVSGTCTDASDVVVDALAWKTVPATYAVTPADWPSYLVNHGLGTLLGEGAATCPKKAKAAPVMMPQAEDLGGCTPNPWPYP
jgi:hypothetical protein